MASSLRQTPTRVHYMYTLRWTHTEILYSSTAETDTEFEQVPLRQRHLVGRGRLGDAGKVTLTTS